MTSKAGWSLVLALIAMLVSSVAMADARDHFRRGQAAYQQGNYDLAITEWLSGYELEQRPEFQYNLAQAYERLGRLQDAANALQRFVESADPDDSSYSDATARLASLQQRLALTGVRVLGGQDGASIFVDGRDWGRLPRPDKISVSPGSHQIVVRLAGFKDFQTNVVIPAGQVIDIEIVMEPGVGTTSAPDGVIATPDPVRVGVGPAPVPVPVPQAAPSRGTSPWLYVGIGTAAVAVFSWGAFLERAATVRECEEDKNFCSEVASVRSQRTLWGVSGAVFTVAAIGSFVLFATDRRSNDSIATSSASCTPGLLAASCTVTF